MSDEGKAMTNGNLALQLNKAASDAPGAPSNASSGGIGTGFVTPSDPNDPGMVMASMGVGADATAVEVYSYSTGDWKDQLVKIETYIITGGVLGTPVTKTVDYDNSGNPTNYLGNPLQWQGKRLTQSLNYTGNQVVNYTYDENGIRLSKTEGSTTTQYYYNGNLLMSMEYPGFSPLLFSYDASGQVVSVNFNGVEYYYVRNGQGDVVKLIDGSGNTMVEYKYDTWGRLLERSGDYNLGFLNPFRYRGYVYDEQTGFYYLNSRYYDPETGRFLNADAYMSTGLGILGYNMYAYCRNNPVSRQDPNGNFDGDNQETLTSYWGSKLLNKVLAGTLSATEAASRLRVLNRAMDWLGMPYVLGGNPYAKKTSKKYGMDCAQVSNYAYGGDAMGNEGGLPERAAYEQYDYVKDSEDWTYFRNYRKKDLNPGDLIFYKDVVCTCKWRTDEIHHVAIYFGDGMMIDAGDPGVTIRGINEPTRSGEPMKIVGYATRF